MLTHRQDCVLPLLCHWKTIYFGRYQQLQLVNRFLNSFYAAMFSKSKWDILLIETIYQWPYVCASVHLFLLRMISLSRWFLLASIFASKYAFLLSNLALNWYFRRFLLASNNTVSNVLFTDLLVLNYCRLFFLVPNLASNRCFFDFFLCWINLLIW